MSTAQRITQNATVLLIAQASSYVLAFFYMMYIARFLGPPGLGVLSFALAFTATFVILADLGLGPLTMREVARDKSSIMNFCSRYHILCDFASFKDFLQRRF